MEIKANEVKALREKTGAGMMDCKKALIEANGDFSAAEKLLREWGIAGIEKRAGRATNEGRIFFVAAGTRIAESALSQKASSTNESLEAIVKEIASLIKENIALRRVVHFYAEENEILHSYLHGEGRIGVVVKVRANDPEAFKHEKIAAFIHDDIALHVAAFNPMFLDESKVSAEWITEQKEIFQKQLELDEKLKSKPEKVLEGILAGKLKKLLADVCLLNQGFVRDEKSSVASILAQISKETGFQLEIVDYYFAKVGQD